MMTITLRIALILVSLGTFAMIMRKIRQSRMQIESAIFWIVLAISIHGGGNIIAVLSRVCKPS